ncbi:MAG TPA: flagellar biosynthesis protein FlhB [Spirochaetales bacterium]|nr:flagellar biosynthesis protein FlhB [Spirochaetales bacterium]
MDSTGKVEAMEISYMNMGYGSPIYKLSPRSAWAARMHLQWFAAEDEGRTEEPTEHKLRKAREEGRVAKSVDLASTFVLLFVVLALALLGPYYLKTLGEMVHYFLRKTGDAGAGFDRSLFRAFLSYFLRLLAPVAGISFIAAIFGNVVQFGFLFSIKPIIPDVNRILPNFSRYLQRTLFSSEALFNLSKSLLKIVLIGLIAYINIKSEMGKILSMLRDPFLSSMGAIANMTFRILMESTLVLLVLSVADYLFQKRQYLEALKMSRQELIEERKTYEGDPLIRSRLRQRMRELMTRTMIQNVPKADVVVTNPTHYAVALEYKTETMEAPMVTAKGQDLIAENIKRVANEHEVPIIENKPLARALYTEVEIGEVIPIKFYEAVAAVLKQVYNLRKERTVNG